ncbi:MAG TPA: hypothetical protein VJI71_01490 [Candidatus Norongarragalinales archaeon]|nr:hypothetical protein [Candidatus Norongarragalinales archaeon]
MNVASLLVLLLLLLEPTRSAFWSILTYADPVVLIGLFLVAWFWHSNS